MATKIEISLAYWEKLKAYLTEREPMLKIGNCFIHVCWIDGVFSLIPLFSKVQKLGLSEEKIKKYITEFQQI
jgi:hypothetical protein